MVSGWTLPCLCLVSGWALAGLWLVSVWLWLGSAWALPGLWLDSCCMCALKGTVGSVWLGSGGALARGSSSPLGSGWVPALSFGFEFWALAAALSCVEAKPRTQLKKNKL